MDFTGRLVLAVTNGAISGLVYAIWAYRNDRWPFAEDGMHAAAPESVPCRIPLPEHGPWDRVAYWDPVPTARAMTGDPGTGPWEERSPLTVPGPFYAGATLDGVNGPYQLPRHVLSADHTQEFVCRQPRTPREVDDLADVAANEPLGSYAWDGDEHWTPESVRAWWADRGTVRAWIRDELADRQGSCNDEEDLRAFEAHLDDGLEDYLRGYVFWLTEEREPLPGEELPELSDPRLPGIGQG